MTRCHDIFPTIGFQVFLNDADVEPTPCLPAGFELLQLKPSWLPDNRWNETVDRLDASLNYSSTREMIQSVYLHLVFLEDLLAINEDNISGPWNPDLCESWMAVRWNEQNDDWKRLMGRALIDSTNCFEETGPQYERPSFFLLTREWMNENDYHELAEYDGASLTFRASELDTPPQVVRDNATGVWSQVIPSTQNQIVPTTDE